MSDNIIIVIIKLNSNLVYKNSIQIRSVKKFIFVYLNIFYLIY